MAGGELYQETIDEITGSLSIAFYSHSLLLTIFVLYN